ncbi:hypothetical protein [Actinophytocola glycyrrhizae]|uniref:Uncharacterized protein n=1 Tax=Actinophytocola glycyrrhizae TaxID=2044873 RepID=A0ABV9SAM2_9PSEU
MHMVGDVDQLRGDVQAILDEQFDRSEAGEAAVPAADQEVSATFGVDVAGVPQRCQLVDVGLCGTRRGAMRGWACNDASGSPPSSISGQRVGGDGVVDLAGRSEQGLQSRPARDGATGARSRGFQIQQQDSIVGVHDRHVAGSRARGSTSRRPASCWA